MDDLVIRGGMVLDGTGAGAVRADLAVRYGRIAAITAHHSGRAKRVVEAQGLTGPSAAELTHQRRPERVRFP